MIPNFVVFITGYLQTTSEILNDLWVEGSFDRRKDGCILMYVCRGGWNYENVNLIVLPLPSFSDCISESGIGCNSKRRTCLPAPCPNTSNISLWNILRNNIGKDLSKVAMPVELNEPLNTLQRLCEELEYSELLDTAAHTPNPFERMVNTWFQTLRNAQQNDN